MDRINKELNIIFNNDLKTSYGSVNKNEPLVIYINGKSWIQPNFIGDYQSIIDRICKNFRHNVKRAVINSDLLENKLVCDFDIKIQSMKENKKSFLWFEFYVKQRPNFLSLSNIKDKLLDLFTEPINNLVSDFNQNTFTLTKSK